MKRRVLGVIGMITVVLLASITGWWARGVIADRTDVATNETPLPIESAEVVQFSVGKSYQFSVTVSRQFEPVTVNNREGTITWLNDQSVNSGDPIYTVDDFSTYAVAGTEPFFRDLQVDVKGDDVAQLQEFLRQSGYLVSPADGKFGIKTEAAVKAWQKKQGLETTGVIELGRMVAMPQLPTPVTFAEGFDKGMMAQVGESVFEAPVGDPKFLIRLNSTQSELVPIGAIVVMKGDNYEWTGVVSSVDANIDGQDELILSSLDGSPVICGEECSVLPASPEITIPSSVQVETPVEGPAVPAVAVLTRTDGTAFVVINGEERDVTILGSGSGMAVLEGVQIGEKVQLPRISGPVDTGTDTAG